MSRHYERKVFRGYINYGYYTNGITIGIRITKYGFELELGLFYVGIEWR